MLQGGELASDIYRPRLRGVTVPYPGNRAGRFSNNFVDLRKTKNGFYLFPGYGYGLYYAYSAEVCLSSSAIFKHFYG